ncbi:MAG: tRNA pseudouridine(38-40) synthase TruA [Candidatus Dormibacteraeota bacterium]|nr:tRNA pseudouridine(38-40) synthase TruA [Candidatus Dormibacteraeota bacterium]MBO0703729.1 tRNA pseudouridine(38-40) synthase TruA [Candidatus Dormibacteraeota bacterium]MBO0760081.1 tRNA pseudouridine(38-40) synthase TruA [Candidatus Dormibacteraeota bacterium]
MATLTLKLVLEYEGTGFAGWQLQAQGERTVEGELRAALGRLPGRFDALHAAGRTDAGAHAEGQVVSLTYAGPLDSERLPAAINAHLPEDVAVLAMEQVDPGFHARYSARWRRYRYRYLDRPARPVLERRTCWHVSAPLNVDAMEEAAALLVGRHDWTTFCSAAEPEQDRVREVREATVGRSGSVVDLELLGEGFLRGMVRGLAAGLAEVGLGRRPPSWLADVLQAGDRSLAPPTAPAGGLTLVEVLYA